MKRRNIAIAAIALIACAGIAIFAVLRTASGGAQNADGEAEALALQDEAAEEAEAVFEGYDYENIRWGMTIEEVQAALESRKTPQAGRPRIWSFASPSDHYAPDMNNGGEINFIAYRETRHAYDSEYYYFRRDEAGIARLCFLQLDYFEPNPNRIQRSVEERVPGVLFFPKAANIKYEPLLLNEAPRTSVNDYIGVQNERSAGRVRYSWADDGSASMRVCLIPLRDNVSQADYANVWWGIYWSHAERLLHAAGREIVESHEVPGSDFLEDAEWQISARYRPAAGVEWWEIYLFKKVEYLDLVFIGISGRLSAQEHVRAMLAQNYGPLRSGERHTPRIAEFALTEHNSYLAEIYTTESIRSARTLGIMWTGRNYDGFEVLRVRLISARHSAEAAAQDSAIVGK